MIASRDPGDSDVRFGCGSLAPGVGLWMICSLRTGLLDGDGVGELWAADTGETAVQRRSFDVTPTDTKTGLSDCVTE